jgi:AraC-like DNA-binding protein
MVARAFGSDLLSTQITEAAYYCPERRRNRARLQLIFAGRETCRTDYRVTRRTFPWLAIELVMRGEGRLRLGRETIPLNVGTVFCYGPGVAHEITTEADHPMVKYFVDFAGPDARLLLAQVPLRPGQVRHALYPQELQEILDHVIEEGNRHSRHSENIALQYLRLFLQKLPECAEYRPHRAASQTLEFYLKAKAFLEKNHETLATAEAAAGSLGVTPETLCRVFQRFASTTPYQYLLRLKINRAVDLLLGTSLQAKEVGYRLGFSDPFHFSRVFKRLQGHSPAHFRRLRERR